MLPRTLGGCVPRGPRYQRKRRASRPPGSFAETGTLVDSHIIIIFLSCFNLVATARSNQEGVEQFRPERKSTILVVAASPQDPLFCR
jgi:hypothetical protein